MVNTNTSLTPARPFRTALPRLGVTRLESLLSLHLGVVPGDTDANADTKGDDNDDDANEDDGSRGP